MALCFASVTQSGLQLMQVRHKVSFPTNREGRGNGWADSQLSQKTRGQISVRCFGVVPASGPNVLLSHHTIKGSPTK